MNKKKNISTLGVLMILIGGIFLLELNGMLPKSFLQEIVNVALGAVVLLFYFKHRKFYLVMLGTFFLTNGSMHLIDSLLQGPNYWTGIFIIPGVMLILAYFMQKKMPYLIPGSLLFFWGLYALSISTGVYTHFASVVGLFFIATALAFFVIAVILKEGWTIIPAFISVGIGLLIISQELGPVARNILLQIVAGGIVLIGIILVIYQKIKNAKEEKVIQKNKEAKDD